MRREQSAEAILRFVAGRERAAAIVGDFSEEGEGRSSAWFWWNVTRTVARLALRPVAAFLAAFVIGIELFKLYGHRVLVRGVTRPEVHIANLVSLIILCGAWSILRYGWTDTASRYLAALAAIGVSWLAIRRAPIMFMALFAIAVLLIAYRRQKTGGETKMILASILPAYAGYWALLLGMPPMRLRGFLPRGPYPVIVLRWGLNPGILLRFAWIGSMLLVCVVACSISRRIFSSDRREKLIA